MSIRSMNQATTTMNQLQKQLDIIGNNMSNSSTTGYKSRQAEFSSLLFQQMNNMTHPENQTGRLTPDGIRTGLGARLGAVNMSNALGSINQTDRDLDAALLNENHFFEIQGNAGEALFTRDGSFYLQPVNNNTEVELVTKNGDSVLGSDGNPIRFASAGIDQIQIEEDGTIMVTRGQQTENVGEISIVSIDNPRILEANGDNNLRLPNEDESGLGYADIVGAANTGGKLLQSGALEMSNVDISNQMTDLISAQRSYQMNARSISTADDMQSLVNQLR